MTSKRQRSKSTSETPQVRSESAPAQTSEARDSSSSMHAMRRPEREAPKTEADKLSDVSALLRGDRPDEETAPEPEEGQPSLASGEEAESGGLLDISVTPVEQPALTDWSVQGIAEALGMDAETVYNKLEFNLGDEEPLTLGQMKDQVGEMQEARRESVRREAALNERESVVNREQSMLTNVVDELRDHLSPEMVRDLQERQSAHETRERHLMLQAMPELKDKTSFDGFREETVEFMGAYGFKPHELDIRDHRMLLALRDAMRLKKMVAKVSDLEEERTRRDPPKAQKPAGRRAAPSNRDKSIQRARAPGATETDMVAGVSALLRKG